MGRPFRWRDPGHFRSSRSNHRTRSRRRRAKPAAIRDRTIAAQAPRESQRLRFICEPFRMRWPSPRRRRRSPSRFSRPPSSWTRIMRRRTPSWAFATKPTICMQGMVRATDFEAIRHARVAIGSDTDDAMALAVGALVTAHLGKDYDTALRAIERALSLNPSTGHDGDAISHRMAMSVGPKPRWRVAFRAVSASSA